MNIEKNIIESSKLIFFFLLLASFGISSVVAKTEALDLELARHLIVEGKPAQAYALLAPYEFEQAGNTKFDYLLGVAALNSGQPGKASIILERVLAVDPLYAAARVDLGRAYYLLGDLEHAGAEFARAQALNPPPAALVTIRQYLRKIEINKQSTRLTGYFELGAGHNNNVNNATSQSLISVPILFNTQLALNAANVKTADGYLGLAAGGEAIHPVSSDWSLYAGVDMRDRSDMKYTNFNFISLDARFGALYSKNAEQIKGGLLTGQFDLGGAVNRKSNGYNLEWSHTWNSTNQAVMFGQHILYRYPDPVLASNDFNQSIAGLGWMHAFGDGGFVVFGSLYGGNETATNLRIDGGKRIQGIRLSGQSVMGEKLILFASGGVQRGQYDKKNSTFLVTRDDLQTDFIVGLTYRYAPNWILRPQISLIKNHSNIIVDQYDQADFSLTLRREF